MSHPRARVLVLLDRTCVISNIMIQSFLLLWRMNLSKHTVGINAGITNTAVTESKERDSEIDSTATCEMEREASRSTTTGTELESAACCLLEKLIECVSSTREGTTLALHRIVRVITIVEALS
jgi:hypothetical protein